MSVLPSSATYLQLDLLPDVMEQEPATGAGSPLAGAPRSPAPDHPHGRVNRPTFVRVHLRGLRSRLDVKAAELGTTTAALVRHAVVMMLGEPGSECPDLAGVEVPLHAHVARIQLRLTPEYAAMLVARARSAGVARGWYVSTLLDGFPAPPRAVDHSAAVAALSLSTDRVAAMSADLNAFLRMLERLPAGELEGYRAGLKSLVGDLRAHLVQASALLADLTPARRPRQ